MNRFFLSTPIYYVNARPHLGHAYTTIAADAAVRFHRLLGQETFFLTGTDEHGDKIVKAAQAADQTPAEYVDSISALFKNLWPELGIDYTRFVRTTSEEHKRCVQAALAKVYAQGDIYFGEYGGHYCFGCERFYTEKELVDGLCPDHLTKPEYIAEKNYFFRMSKYQDWLLDHIRQNPDFIRPEQYRSEVVSLLESGALEDLCISRPKSRLTWGVELPFDANYVTYVWFDALINYVSALNWPDGDNFAKFWPVAEHLVAKDILKPHAIFWPTMLKAMGLEPYKHLNVHGYWLVKHTKMSKSLGNVIEPLKMVERFGLDGFRYFLLREMSFGSDSSFSEEAIELRFNSDLANDLGNLMSRTLSMTQKYFDGLVPPLAARDESEREIIELCKGALENFQRLFGRMQSAKALDALWELVRALNRYIDQSAPWTLFKQGETGKLGSVLYVVLECLRKVALHLWPIMPASSQAMLEQLGLAFDPDKTDLAAEIDSFGLLPQGGKLAPGSNLFPRIESAVKPDKSEAKPAKAAKSAAQEPQKASEPAQLPATIEFPDFQKLDLRLGQVLSAERLKGSDRLLLTSIDIGEDKARQIVAGLAEHFTPEDLIGRQVVVLANLAPRKLRGAVSEGMILAVREGDRLALLTSSAPLAPGSKVS